MSDVTKRVQAAMGVDNTHATPAEPSQTLGEAGHASLCRRLQVENSELRAHAGRLVELLEDAWWVEAAEHLACLRDIVNNRREKP